MAALLRVASSLISLRQAFEVAPSSLSCRQPSPGPRMTATMSGLEALSSSLCRILLELLALSFLRRVVFSLFVFSIFFSSDVVVLDEELDDIAFLLVFVFLSSFRSSPVFSCRSFVHLALAGTAFCLWPSASPRPSFLRRCVRPFFPPFAALLMSSMLAPCMYRRHPG